MQSYYNLPTGAGRVIEYANVIEALEYLHEEPTTTFAHPLSITPIMIKMLTDDDKAFLKSFKHLRYSSKEKVRNQVRVNNHVDMSQVPDTVTR